MPTAMEIIQGATSTSSSAMDIIKNYGVSKPTVVSKPTTIQKPTYTPIVQKSVDLLSQAKSTVKKIADFTIKLVSPTIKSPIPLSDEERTKIATQKVTQPVSIKPDQTKLDEKQLGVIGQVKKTVSDINEKLGPVLEKYIYTPSEYQKQAIETGKKPKLTAGKVIGGAIEDAINAFLPVSGIGLKGTTEAVKLTTRLTEGLKTGTTFAGLTALIKAFKEEKIEPVDLLTSGGIGAWIGFSSPTVMKNISKDVEISARQSLEKFGFKSSDYKNIEALKSKFNKVAMKLHPDKGGNAKDFQNFVEAYNKMTSSGIEPTWKLPDIKEWVKNIWSNSKKSTSEKEIIKKQADEDFVNLVKSVIEKTKSEIQIGEKTPQQAIGEIIKSGQEKTPEGKEIIKSALEAQKTGQNILVEKTTPPLSPTAPKVSRGEIKQGSIKPQIEENLKEEKIIAKSTIGTPKLAKGVRKKAIKNKIIYGFDKTFNNLPEYDKVDVKEQGKKASELVLNDPETAFKMAMGKIQPPSDILPESMFVAVENYAIETKNVEVLRQLATQSELTMQATGMGQRIRMLAERNPESAVKNMRDVIKTREEAFKKIHGGKSVNEAIKNIKKQIKVKLPDKYDWNNFINSIDTC